MSVFDNREYDNHEQALFCRDEEVGLRPFSLHFRETIMLYIRTIVWYMALESR